jgi:hypothetical protein
VRDQIEVEDFVDGNKNQNTRRKTLDHLRLLKSFLEIEKLKQKH